MPPDQSSECLSSEQGIGSSQGQLPIEHSKSRALSEVGPALTINFINIFKKNNAIMSRPLRLFLADKQTWAESKLNFYQNRHFTFQTYHRSLLPSSVEECGEPHPFDALMAWLDSIGLTGRRNLRHSTVVLEEYSPYKYPQTKASALEQIHDKLSDKATADYEGSAWRTEREALWDTGVRF